MSGFIRSGDNRADAITGDRIFPHDIVFNTGCYNINAPHSSNGRTRVVKESTIVWLAEQAGYVVTKRDAGNSDDAEVVDGQDVGVGDGEVEVGEVEAGGSTTVSRRSNRTTKGK
jgi:hypothetical protein